jgi:hypothetical protein
MVRPLVHDLLHLGHGHRRHVLDEEKKEKKEQ